MAGSASVQEEAAVYWEATRGGNIGLSWPLEIGSILPAKKFPWRYNKSVLYWPMTGYRTSCTHTTHTHTHVSSEGFFHWELRYEIATIAPEPKILCSLLLYSFLFFPLIVRWQRHLDGLPDQATIDFSAALH